MLSYVRALCFRTEIAVLGYQLLLTNWRIEPFVAQGLTRQVLACHSVRSTNDSFYMVTGGFLVTKVRYHRDISPRSSCNNGWRSPSERFPSGQVMSSLFWPFFGVLLPCFRNLSSAITSIRDHDCVECRMMLRKNYLSWTDWTSTQHASQAKGFKLQGLTCVRYITSIKKQTNR
jgi:hypothetical protein